MLSPDIDRVMRDKAEGFTAYSFLCTYTSHSIDCSDVNAFRHMKFMSQYSVLACQMVQRRGMKAIEVQAN